MEENYVPYGEEWEAEMKKFSKPQIESTFGISQKDEHGFNRTKTEMIQLLRIKLKSETR